MKKDLLENPHDKNEKSLDVAFEPSPTASEKPKKETIGWHPDKEISDWHPDKRI
jgi:hypothetical protein